MKTLNDFLYSEIQYNDKHGKFKNKNLTPVMFYELWDICCAVSRGYAYNTISKDAANICRKYGLSVQKEGVGWRVSGGDEMNSKTICGHCERIEYCRMFLKDPHAVVSECGKYEETDLHKSIREMWNGFHGQVTAKKGTFKKILAESEE